MITIFKKIINTFHSKRMFKNTGILLGGEFLSSILGLISFTLTARFLGVENFGILVLIDAYVTIIDKFINFQSWQFMVKYGADALEEKTPDNFKALVKFGTLIDISTAFLGFLTAYFLADWVGNWQNLSQETIQMAKLYSVIILFNFTGIPSGILRLFKKFKRFASRKLIGAVVKLTGVVIACFMHGSLMTFLWVWIVTEIVGYLILTFSCWEELKKQGFGGPIEIMKQPLQGIIQKNSGVWGFLISTNLTGSFKVGFKEFDVLIVGKLLGIGDVALYKLTKKFAYVLKQVVAPIYEVIYPELATLWARQNVKEFKQLARHACALIGVAALAAWLIFVATGKFVIILTTGSEYLDAYPLSVLYIFAEALGLASLPLAPVIVSVGKPVINLLIQIFTSIMYFPLLFVLINMYGLIGAGWAYIGYFIIKTLWQFYFIKTYLRGYLNKKGKELKKDQPDPNLLPEI